MNKQSPPGPPNKTWSGPAVLTLIGVLLVVPATFTLLTVERPGERVIPPDPTPYGYTVSLLLFLVPIVALGWWLARRPDLVLARRALKWAIPLLFVLGFALDFLFAHLFFTFTNLDATLGVEVPVVGGKVPVEEFVFYLTGFVAVLLTYLWADEAWLARYNDGDYAGALRGGGRLLRFHAWSLAVGLVLLALGWAYKQFLSADPGFPAYYAFLLAASIVPAMALLGAVKSFVNWRAFSLTFFWILLVSLLWEGTLASPYGWWGYQPQAMLGIDVDAWSYLPIEAVLVWFAVTWTTVIVYEVIKLWLASGKSARAAFLGT